MDRERLFEAFLQTASRARVQMHQLEMQLFQRAFGIGIISHGRGVLPFPSEVGFILFRQVIDDVAFLVNLTALEEGCLASGPADRRRPGLAALYDLPPWRAEIASALPPIAQQGSHDGR